MKLWLFSLLTYLVFFPHDIYGQEDFVFEDRIFDTNIASPQVYPVGNPLGFAYASMSGEVLEFNFDLMGTDRQSLNFAIIHCDKNWRRSDLLPSAFMVGYQFTNIEFAEASFNTQIDYIHYNFQFPNENMYPKFSGNYAVVVLNGSDLEDTSSYVLSYRTIFYESAVGVNAVVSASSNPGDRRFKQQVDFDVYPSTSGINSPLRDLSCSVIQNYDWTNSIHNLKPIFLGQNKWTFDYNGEVDFDAGSEWRFFEFKNFQFKSQRVQEILQTPLGREVFLEPELPMGNMAYSSFDDLNGKAFIKNDLGDDSNLDADYSYVHFLLSMPILAEGKVFLEYDFGRFMRTQNQCTYNPAKGGYECTLLLKQGLYNYRYAIEDRYHVTPDLSLTEGNHSETRNTYTVVVYFSDRTLGYDRVMQVYTVN
jgi:hypothetical protein